MDETIDKIQSEYENGLKNNYHKLMKKFLNMKNLKQYLNLPNKIYLYNYINDFLKKTNFDYFIGIKYFYNIKNKDLDYIESNEFYESLLNIFPNTIYQSLLNDDNQFNVKSFVKMIGENYLILCLETIKYNKYGLNSYELSNSLSSFFPNISKNLIKNFIMSIDKQKKGNISYLQLFHFIYNFTNEKFSYNIFIKLIASFLDINEYPTYQTICSNILIDLDDIITPYESNYFFRLLGIEREELKVFYSHNYITLNKLLKDVNFIRENKLYYNKLNEIIKNFEVVNIKKKFKKYELNLNDIDILNIDNNLNISVIEINKYFKNKLYILLNDEEKQKIKNKYKIEITKDNLDKLLKKIFLLLKYNDINKNGMIQYKQLYNLFQFSSPKLHMKYITKKYLVLFNGDINKYYSFKNINEEDNDISKSDYEFLLKENEMLNNRNISNDLFDFFNNKNKFSISKYIKYINFLFNEIKYDGINYFLENYIIEEEINIYENNKHIPFYNFFNNIKLENIYGKIKTNLMEKYLDEYINMDYEKICLFLRKFSKNKLLLFDLISFSNKIQNITKYPIEPLNVIEAKINKQENKSTYFLFNINKLNLIEFFNIMNIYYNLDLYECIIIYDKYSCNQLNKYKDNYELDMQFFLKEFNIINRKIEININDNLNNNQQNKNMDIYNYNKQMQDFYQSQLKSKNQIKKFNKINSNKYNIFKKFCIQVKTRSQGDLYKYFKQFDKNNDDIINKDEFLDILSTFHDFNDYEKISIINYSNKKHYDEINILKLINIINSISLDDNELEEIENNKHFNNSRNTSSFFNSDLSSLNSEYYYKDVLEIEDNIFKY